MIRKALFAVCLTVALGGLVPATMAATILVSADITTSQTWTPNNTYVLQIPVYVTNGATLTIEPGTVVRGEPQSAPGANDPGTLIISRDSKIRAIGTSKAPIVFTDLNDDNIGSNPGTPPYDDRSTSNTVVGQWGGVILLGRTFVANNTGTGPNPAREVQIEGLTAAGGKGLYGNCAADATDPRCDDDDSGEMSYVSIRYGGFNLSANNEINGLTLGGVGRSTKIDHIEVYNTKDDCYEWFGGTVNMKYIVCVNSGDDGIDYDEGYRGKMQFVFVMQGVPTGEVPDKGGEHDGGNGPDNSKPKSIPTIYNATYIGLGGVKNYSTPQVAAKDLNIHFRDDSGGRYYNSFFGDFGGATMMIEGGDLPGGSPTAVDTSGERAITPYVAAPTGYCRLAPATSCLTDPTCGVNGPCVLHYQGPNSGNELEFEDNTFWCFGQFDTNGDGTVDVPSGEQSARDGDANKNHYGYPAFSNAALDNNYVPCGGALPINRLDRVPAIPATNPDPVDKIDPVPAPGSPLRTTNRTPPNDGFFVPANYRGAFGDENWAYGWTQITRLGYFGAKPRINVNADITTSQTWSSANDYVLQLPVYVTNGATLTILPGTVIRGEPQSAPGANDPGTLIISRDSKIRALGTEDDPITFTDLDDDNVSNNPLPTPPYDFYDTAIGQVGHWGGLILLGRTFVANNTGTGPNPTREVQIEGLTAAGGKGLYGNCSADVTDPRCDDDDSGEVHYVSIRYGGFNLSANNEINGLTLGGVGRSTQIDHVESFNTKDDCFEWFGGTVNMRNIMCVNSGDDGIDYDEGYRGKMQFVFVMQGVPTGEVPDKGGEHDGGNGPDNSKPKSIPTIANATYLGLGGVKNYSTPQVAAKDLNIHFRDDSGGRYYNSFFGDFGGATMMIEGGDLPGGSPTGPDTSGERAITPYITAPTGYCRLAPATSCLTNAACGVNGPCVLHYQSPGSDFELEFRDNSFWCFGQFDTNGDGTVDVPSGEQSARDGDANKNHYGYPAFSTASLQNQYLRCVDPLPIRQLTRGTASPATNPDPVTAVDPRPAPGSPLLTQPKYTDARLSGDGFFQPTSYRGAFGGTNWANCWTAVSRVGYFPSCDALHPNAVPDEVSNLLFDPHIQGKTTMVWDDVTFNRAYFDVLRSTKASDFSSSFAICLESHDTDLKATDSAVPSVGTAFFYLVRAGNPCGKGTLGYGYSGGSSTERTSDLSCP